jgi:FixJ family two-component response regulator
MGGADLRHRGIAALTRSVRTIDMAEHIYIVDDDEAVRDSLRALFEAYGFTVHDFASGTEFLRQYAPSMQGCVLLDVDLPGMDGIQVLKVMAKAGDHLPVIVMTAKSDGQTNADAIGAGAAAFLQKPFAGGHVMDLVRAALHDRH